MSRKYSIGFLLAAILIIVLLVIAYRMSYQRALEKNESQKESEEQPIQADAEICYYIKELDGYVTVFEADKRTVYEYTSILVSDLPEDIQEKLKDGIKVTSLGQVYGFLENYSS